MLNRKLVLIIALPLLLAVGILIHQSFTKPPIKVGIMHSLTGPLAISEKGMVDALLFSIEEINLSGGLLGRTIEPIVIDGKSDPQVFAEAAEKLIEDEKVDVVFGCWASSCRKSVLPVFEENDHLLYYSLQYEGIEQSDNVVYIGSVPNQQVVPALEWSFSHFGKRVYLIGSEYVYPRAANEIIRDQVQAWRGEVVGESYIYLDNYDFDAVVDDIIQSEPDVILNTINGRGNLAFFKTLRAKGIQPEDIPTFSFSVSESELSLFEGIDMEGDYLVWNYLQGLETDANEQFVNAFKQRFGEDVVIGSSMLLGYMSVKFWAKSVTEAQSSDPADVRSKVADISIQGPSGMLYIDKETQHTWRSMHISRINGDRKLESVWFSGVPIAPKPYPESRTVAQWNDYLDQLKIGWSGLWQPALRPEHDDDDEGDDDDHKDDDH